MLILYLATLLNCLNNSNNESKIDCWEFPMWVFISLANNESFISSFFILIFLLFFFLPCWTGYNLYYNLYFVSVFKSNTSNILPMINDANAILFNWFPWSGKEIPTISSLLRGWFYLSKTLCKCWMSSNIFSRPFEMNSSLNCK